ncbi:MAG: hypothetical protein HN768_02745, partial [Rhodospirillaceae bacterium]|nr:hypothetical protein [Rhodospirillaceae bacterium]
PESEVTVSFRDRGFKYGEAVYDATRTVKHKPFKLHEHIERLFCSMRYLEFDAGLTHAEFVDITLKVLELNEHLLGPDDDVWLTQRVSPGAQDPFEGASGGPPTVIVECTPIPFRSRATLFRDGVDVRIPSIRRTPPDAQSPRAKSQNYINFVLADNEVRSADPNAWTILLDQQGNLTEGMGSNIFCVRDGRLLTPKARFVLAGISRETVIELARSLGLAADEADIDLFDAYNADECFLSSTSLCMVPVATINGRRIGKSTPGPITQQLTDAYKNLIDLDFVAQYLKHLEP